MLRRTSLILMIFILLASCTEERIKIVTNNSSSKEIWYKQIDVDLGRKIEIKSQNFGLAISRGKGTNIKGKAYLLLNNEWKSFFEFAYSDYPIIKKIDNDRILLLIHETHFGNYRPRMFIYRISGRKISEVKLPVVMWDKKDFLLWKALTFFDDGKAWMVGQLGKLMFFDGYSWTQRTSPLDSLKIQNVLGKDLNDVCLNKNGTGWAVGNSGIILQLNDSRWQRINSPVTTNLNKVVCSDEIAMAVGQNGTILIYKNSKWNVFKSNSSENLNSIKIINANDIWICGSNSTLLHYDGKKIEEIEEVKIFKDNFNDIDIILDSTGHHNIYLIGDEGIYSNSRKINFSFTNITSEVSLQRNGISALSFDANNDYYPELLVKSEKGPNVFYQNNSGINFIETQLPLNQNSSELISNYAADFNNDGFNDLILLTNEKTFKFLLGKGNNEFIDFTNNSGLKFEKYFTTQIPHSIQSADFDNDGNLDLYAANYFGEDKLFMGDGSGHFSEIKSLHGIENFPSHENHGVVLADFNSDNLVDIFRIFRLPVENQIGELYLNKGNFQFQKKNESVLEDKNNLEVYSSLAEDFNNDGFTDLVIFVNNDFIKIFINDGKANFIDYSSIAGFNTKIFHPEPSNGVIGAADVNNDGYKDLFVSSKIYLNNSKTHFDEIENQFGLSFFGNPTFTDFDNDGDIDIFIGSSRNALGAGDRSALFKNNLNKNNFVKLKIVGDESNSSAIGAKVLLLGYKNGKLINKQLNQVGLGGNPISSNEISAIHFGLNSNYKYKIQIEFPSGKKQLLDKISSGELIVVHESNIILRFYSNLVKTLIRFFNVNNFLFEIIKLILILSVLTIIQKKYLKTGSKYRYLNKALFLIFLIVYVTVRIYYTYSNQITIIIFSLGVILIHGFTVYLINYFIEKSESKFVSHFKLLEIIGVGGMGKVFKAIDINNKKIVALKVINPEIMKDEENQKRLSAEGEILSSIQHPNIVEVFEIGKGKEHTFVAMEFLPNGSLEDYIQKNYPISFETAKKIIEQICCGLEAIHQKQVIHRDLKSTNIMFDEKMNIKIMDFGLSKSPLITTMTSLGTVLGTLGFVAPEQVTNINVDHRTDIFSLGVIMYQMFTKQLPFKGENEIALIHSIFNTIPKPPIEINIETPVLLNKIILKCLEKNPENRYNSVVEIKEELNTI